MADLLVRGLPEKTHLELKRRAEAHGRSVNAEVLAVLDDLAKPKEPVGLGTQLQEWKKKHYGDILKEDPDFDFEVVRDRTPARFADFSGPEYDWADAE